MVATRRRTEVSSPAKTVPEQSSDVLATPSTGRRTRTAVKQVECPTHHVLVETSSQPEKGESEPPASPPASLMKRCTRASRLHSPEQSCTPVGSAHEADMSDLESCCSVLSDIDPPATRTRGRRRPACAVIPKDENISEVESCSSVVSASKATPVSRRSTRRSTAPKCYDPARVGEVMVDHALESESCSSVVSESKRVTRSQRKTACSRSSAKQQTEDSEVSDAESFISGGSRAKVSHKARKPRRPTHSIPLDLDEATENSHSPAPRSRPIRAVREKAPAIIDVIESPSPDSEGFESGPTYSMTTRPRGKTKTTNSKAVDSDSELTDGETPCSSRTGSGNSSARVSTHSFKDLSIVVERTRASAEEDSVVDDSRLESTLTTDDVDCTLLEEHESQTLEEKVVGNSADLTSSEADTKKVERGEKEVVTEPAVMAIDQQEELSTKNKDGDTSEVEMTEEMIRSLKPLKPCQSVSVTCEKASETIEEKGQTVEVAEPHIQSSQGDKPGSEDAVEETQPSVEEKMEVSTLSTDAQQVVETGEAQVSSIQVTFSQHNKITVDSVSVQQSQDVVVHKTKVISLLDSSDDEDDVSAEEEEDDLEYRTAGPSKVSETAVASVEGLFMIDTRPGQDANEQYYKERPTEEQEDTANRGAEEEQEDEEFVDEEDDEDDDAELLFSSRSHQLNEMSTRIDPGIRVKELGGLYINFGGKKSKPVSSSLQKLKETKIQDEVMKKSVIGPDFEKKDAVPPYSESKHALKLKRRAERAMTTGDGWFNMKAPEITPELKTDLSVLKMRGSMDPKRFYKKNDRDGFPKYFQVGSVVDSAVDFYHSRIPKKERKRTMVEELLADAEFRHQNKKKYQQIVSEKAAQGAGKKNRKKNKFRKK